MQAVETPDILRMLARTSELAVVTEIGAIDRFGFLDVALQNSVAKLAFRGVLGGVRAISAAAPKTPSALLDQAAKRFPDLVNMGALTIISNIYGNPAVSIPAGRSMVVV